MRLILTFLTALVASPSFAHIGHLGEVAGHGHWIALGGIAIAAGIALLGARKKPKQTDVKTDAEDTPEDGEPA